MKYVWRTKEAFIGVALGGKLGIEITTALSYNHSLSSRLMYAEPRLLLQTVVAMKIV